MGYAVETAGSFAFEGPHLSDEKSKRLWQVITDACRAGDWQEALRVARSLVDADPFAIDARQLLAALYLRVGNRRLAQIQYEKLLPLAVGRGDLFRALAVQKHLDQVGGGALRHANRFVAMHKWFRSAGVTRSITPGSRPGAGITQADLLRLPREVFSQTAENANLELLDMEPRSVPVQAGSLWVVLYGQLEWSLTLSDGRATARRVAEPGKNIYVDPEISREVRLDITPLVPCECLRFEAEVVQELLKLMPALALALNSEEGIVVDERSTMPLGPRPQTDLDHAPPPPAEPNGFEPRSLSLASDTSTASSASDWVDFGMVELSGDAAPADAPAGSGSASAEDPGERTLVLPTAAESSRSKKKSKGKRPVVGETTSVEMDDGLVMPGMRDPFAEPRGDIGDPIERRRDSRVAVTISSRLAILGLGEHAPNPVSGSLADLSVSGMGVRFSQDELSPMHAALEDAVLSVELELAPPELPLRLAGRVRRLDQEDETHTVLLGVEFVLLTDLDRARLLEAVDQSDEGQGRVATG